MTKTALYIGRFQPLHNGHMSAIDTMMCENDNLKIGVGSSQLSFRKENPFDYEERRQMLELAVCGPKAVYPIPDINDDERWVSHVKGIIGDFDVVYTGNDHVRRLFVKEGYAVKPVESVLDISGTKVREMMAKKDSSWRRMVPYSVERIIDKIEGERRLAAIFENKVNPALAVDLIIRHNDGEKEGIVLIKRRDGRLALPGGFVNYGESTETAAVREGKEETNLDLVLERLSGVYSEPSRDPRTHVASVAYVAKGAGRLQGLDDASKGAFVVDPKEAVKMDLAFDHNRIVKEFLDKE